MAATDCRCANCGDDFQGRQVNSMYCDKRCKLAAWRKANPSRPNERKVSAVYCGYCAKCGDPFTSRRKRAHCGESCERAARHERTYKSVAPPTRVCRACRTVFAAHPAKTRPIDFCGQACKEEAERAHKRVSRLRRKAAERAAIVESVDPFKVFDRDGWLCRLCGVATPRGKRGTCHPDAPELDHIVPLAKGGDHSYRNVQCACRRCNGLKSDRLVA